MVATAAPLLDIAFTGLKAADLGQGLLRSPEARCDHIILLAAKKAAAAVTTDEPKGKPRMRPAEEAPAEADLPPPPTAEELERAALDRVSRLAAFLKTLRGKYVPWGPKPWDPHRFTRVMIYCSLDPKQAANTKIMNQVLEELRRVSCRPPHVTLATKNVASIGQRLGAPAGAMVSIAGKAMKDFLTRLNTIVLPRVRDFEGLNPADFTYLGDYRIIIPNQEPFKELDELIDQRELVHPFKVVIVNNCMTQMDGLALMKTFGFPFTEFRARPPKRKLTEEEVQANFKANFKAARGKK